MRASLIETLIEDLGLGELLTGLQLKRFMRVKIN